MTLEMIWSSFRKAFSDDQDFGGPRTDAEFARNAGMTQGNLSRLEKGKSIIRRSSRIFKIASENGYDLEIRFKKEAIMQWKQLHQTVELFF